MTAFIASHFLQQRTIDWRHMFQTFPRVRKLLLCIAYNKELRTSDTCPEVQSCPEVVGIQRPTHRSLNLRFQS